MRPVFAYLFLGLGPFLVASAACGSSGDAAAPSKSADAGATGAEGGADSGIADSSHGSDAGDASRGTDGSMTSTSPIKHVVVIVKENHTFDNYFGTFPGAEGATSCKTTTGTVPAPHAPNSTPRDMCHEHQCALDDWDQGKNDGWLMDPASSMNGDNLFCAQYQEADIPNYWAYARKFGLADHFFANVLGPSFPGHTFVLAAQAGWSTGNPPTDLTSLHPYWGCDEVSTDTVPILQSGTCTGANVFPCFDIPSVPDLLPTGVDWRFYGTSFYVLTEIWSMFDAVKSIRNGPGWGKVVNASTFDSDVQSGKLPPVTWLVDQDLNDEHPNVGGVCQGENWTVGHINALMASPLWKDTAIFFTMDDFGGWYDHVPPPRQYGCDAQHPYGLGFRLPLVVISPYAKQGVFKGVLEQASIPRFLLTNFGATKFLADMDPAAQDKQAGDLTAMFDFNQTPLDPVMLTPRATCPP